MYLSVDISIYACYHREAGEILTGDTGGVYSSTLRRKNNNMQYVKKQLKRFGRYTKEEMTKKRYMGNHPRCKKAILVGFLLTVVSFVGWNITLQMPQYEFKLTNGPITLENPAMASNLKPQEVSEPEPEVKITDCYTAAEVMGKKHQAPVELMKRIIKSESGNQNTAANRSSTARGCAQWILGSWETYGKKLWGEDFYQKNIYAPADNVELLAWTIANYGTSPWDASRHNWGR